MKLKDSIGFGIGINVLVSIVLFFIFTTIIGVSEFSLQINDGIGVVVPYFFAFPLAFVVAGVGAGFVFNQFSCPRAAKVNFILALIFFLVGGTCSLPFLAA